MAVQFISLSFNFEASAHSMKAKDAGLVHDFVLLCQGALWQTGLCSQTGLPLGEPGDVMEVLRRVWE